MALLDGVATILATAGVGTRGTDLFNGQMPQRPANCMAITLTGGYPPLIHTDVDRPTFQVKVRNTSYAAAESKAYAVYNALHNYGGTSNSVIFLQIQAMQTPTAIGKDENDRFLFSINFECYQTNTAPTNR